MAAQIIVVVAVADDGRPGRIEGDLEVIRQVPIGRVITRRIESILGDISSVVNVVACLLLTERRSIALDVGPKRIEDMPVSGIVQSRKFIAPVPNHPDRPGDRPGCHPRKDRRQRFRSIAYANGRAPGISLIGGIPNENIVIV